MPIADQLYKIRKHVDLATSTYTRVQDKLNPRNAYKPTGGEQGLVTSMLAHLTKEALARPNRFYLYVTPPLALMRGLNITDLGTRFLLMCEDIEFPGKQIATTENRIYGPQRKMPYGMTYPETSLSFKVSTSLFERTFFDKWQDLVVNYETNNVGYYNEYTTSIEVYQANTRELGYASGAFQVTQPGIVLKEVYPVSINALPYSATSDNAYQKQTITVAYHTWARIEQQRAEEPIPTPYDKEKQGINYKPLTVARKILDNLTGIGI